MAGKYDITLTVKVNDDLMETLSKTVLDTDKSKSNVIRASLILGLAVVANHPELVNQFGGPES